MTSTVRALAKHAAVLCLSLVLTSCFTMMVWGFDTESECDAASGDSETTFAYDEETEWSWGLFFGRLGLTPFAIVLDVLTCPVQAVLFGWDDDEGSPK
jgi:hypothetical protein